MLFFDAHRRESNPTVFLSLISKNYGLLQDNSESINMKAIHITAYPENASQVEAIKAVIKAFKIKYHINTVESESVYNPDFVAMIKQGEDDLKKGKGISMTLPELEKLCK